METPFNERENPTLSELEAQQAYERERKLEKGKKMVERFKEKYEQLREILSKDKGNETPQSTDSNESTNGDETLKQRPRVAVVVSLWEADKDMLTSKMFGNSIKELVKQADDGEMDLDIIIVINNGGAKEPEIGKNLVESVVNSVSELEINANHVDLSVSNSTQNNDSRTPLEIPIQDGFYKETKEKGHSCVIVTQPHSPSNQGKTRAMRDASNLLENLVVNQDYKPDAVFQMDAETVLRYNNDSRGESQEDDSPPLRKLYNLLKDGGLMAVGTKDEFAIMDEDGRPTNSPVGSSQFAYMLHNNNPDVLITMPGGALMADPAAYIAGMRTISAALPSVGTEDYAFTKLLRAYASSVGKGIPEIARSCPDIFHLNRTPRDINKAIAQMVNWRSHARAVDAFFPEDPYEDRELLEYVVDVVIGRLRQASSKGDVRHLLKLLEDVGDIPAVLRKILNSQEIPDIESTKGGSTWTPVDKKEQ